MIKRVFLYFISAAVGIMCAVIFSGVFLVTGVSGNGMEPTLENGDRILINKLAYADDMPENGDIVAVRNHVYGEEGEGSVLVRRVAGREGDSIEIKNNMFYLNGKPYTEHMKEPVHMEDMDRLRLKNNRIFIFSDNRKSSMDSRNEAIGTVDMRDCIGKVCFK